MLFCYYATNQTAFSPVRPFPRASQIRELSKSTVLCAFGLTLFVKCPWRPLGPV